MGGDEIAFDSANHFVCRAKFTVFSSPCTRRTKEAVCMANPTIIKSDEIEVVMSPSFDWLNRCPLTAFCRMAGSILENVAETGKPLVLTRHEEIVGIVYPPHAQLEFERRRKALLEILKRTSDMPTNSFPPKPVARKMQMVDRYNHKIESTERQLEQYANRRAQQELSLEETRKREATLKTELEEVRKQRAELLKTLPPQIKIEPSTPD